MRRAPRSRILSIMLRLQYQTRKRGASLTWALLDLETRLLDTDLVGHIECMLRDLYILNLASILGFQVASHISSIFDLALDFSM